MSDYEKLIGSSRNDLIDVFYEMVVKTYQKIGIPVTSPNELLELAEWHVYPNSKNPLMIAGYKKTPFGLKYTIVGSDGSPEGKSLVKDSLKMLNTAGFYGELSHRLQDVAEDIGVPKVPVENVENIINKKVTPLDEYRYSRDITNVGRVEKTMFGRPNKIQVNGMATLAETISNIAINWDSIAHRMCILP